MPVPGSKRQVTVILEAIPMLSPAAALKDPEAVPGRVTGASITTLSESVDALPV